MVVTGLSHRTAPIDVRERFAQHTRDLERTYTDLRKLSGISEACVISTCNRVEFYVAGSDEPPALGRVLRAYIHSFCGIHPQDIDPHLYQHDGVAGLKHLFRVASSLDSMVLGEPQILGQVKEAFRDALTLGAAGPHVTSAFQKAFAVAKRIRTDTGIAENAVSMSFAAVELGRRIFTALDGKHVLVIGAGKMSTLAARHLKAYGVSEVRVANRSLQAAQKLADEIGGLASSLSDLHMLLANADIVISSTASSGFVIDKPLMSRVLRERRYRPILLVDIAMPRDVDPAVASLDNVFLYDVDDLEEVLEDNRKTRQKEAEAAERIIDLEVSAFAREAKSRQVDPMIKALRSKVLAIAEAEVERTLSRAKGADQKTTDSIRAMGPAIVNKMLHPIMKELKRSSADGDPQPLIDVIVRLFEIDHAALSAEPPPDAEVGSSVDQSNVVPLRSDRES
jgi:glutamyl-tRNA reductase